MNSFDEYLQREYLTIEALVEQSQATEEKIIEFIGNQCVPPHSYEVNHTRTITCNLKGASPIDSVTVRYYNPSIVAWIQSAENLLKQGLSINEVAYKVRQAFSEKFQQLFGDAVTPGCKGLDAAWRYWANGTWGICLQDISVENMAKKELSRLKISKLCKLEDPHHTLTAAEKAELQQAVNDYESVVKAFAPHLLPVSSRRLEVEPAVAKYL